MRKVTLLVALIAFTAFTFAQKEYPRHQVFPKAQSKYSEDVRFYTLEEYNELRPGGDVIMTEDFGGGAIPAGWTVVDNTGSDYDWRWDDQGPTGQYSDNMGPIESTTGANGFMLYDGDAFDLTTIKDAYFEIPAQDFSSYTSVVIKFEERMRFCCDANAGFWVEVSTDGFTTETDYDVSYGLQGNDPSDNPVVAEVNISAVAAGQSSVGIRFHFDTNIAYFWMVDDIVFKTAFDNEMILDFFYPWFETAGFYSEIPMLHNHGMNFGGEVSNNGAYDQTNVVLSVDVLDNTETSIHTASSPTPTTVAPLAEDSLSIEDLYTLPAVDTGTYDFEISVEQTETDDNPGNNSNGVSVNVNPNRYCRALNWNATTGPQYFVDGADGDGIGCYYYLMVDDTAESVSIRLSSSTTEGITLIARVYLDGDPPTEVIASDEYVVTAADLGEWVTIPLVEYGDGEQFLTADTWYIAFVEGYFGDNDWRVAADKESYHDFTTGLLRVSDTWYILSPMPFVSLDFYRTPIPGINDVSDQSNIEVYPNPTSGELNVNNVEGADIFIYNMLGEQVAVVNNANAFNTIDMSEFAEGSYVVKIMTDENVTTKKVNLVK